MGKELTTHEKFKREMRRRYRRYLYRTLKVCADNGYRCWINIVETRVPCAVVATPKNNVLRIKRNTQDEYKGWLIDLMCQPSRNGFGSICTLETPGETLSLDIFDLAEKMGITYAESVNETPMKADKSFFERELNLLIFKRVYKNRKGT